MNVEQALVLLDAILQQECLSDIQELVFRQAWEGHTYPEIAEKFGYDANYIKDVGSKLWKLLSKTLAEEVTKSNFRSVLRRQSRILAPEKTITANVTTKRDRAFDAASPRELVADPTLVTPTEIDDINLNSVLTLDFSQEEALTKVLPQLPILTSKEAGWNGIYLAYDRYQLPGETPEFAAQQYGISIFTEVPQPIRAKRKLDDRLRYEQVVQGDVVIVPANTGQQVQWDNPGSVLMLGFEPTVFNYAIYEMVAPERVAIAPHFATPDPLICQLGLTLKRELESGGLGSRLYAETIANLLAVHLLQHYSTQKPIIKEYTGGLPKYKLQQVIEYINAHLDLSLGLTELAQIVQMSPGYFSRLFKQSTGLAPHQYLIQCRVQRAKRLLCKGEFTIAEVAYQVGFANQGHLNYHFKRLVGITPKAIMQK